MFGNVVLIRKERAYTAQLQDALSAVQHGQFVHSGKVFAQLLIVQAVADLAPAALTGVEGIDGLLAQRLVQLLQRGRLLAAQEQGCIAVSDDGIGAVLIQRLQLGLRLKHQAGGNLTASDRRHQLFQIGNLSDVGALVNEAAHMNRQTPAELVIRLFTEQIEELAVNHGNEEVEGAVRVAHDEEQHGFPGIAFFGSAQRIQLQFIIHGDLPKLLNVKGSKARTGGNIDAFRSFAGGQLVFSPLTHGEVVGVTLTKLPECDIYVVFKSFIILTHLHCIDEFYQCCEVLLLLRCFIIDVADERRVKQSLRLEPEIIASFAFALGVGNQSIDQLQNILLAVNVGERVIVHRLFEIDGVEHLNFVPCALHQPAALDQETSFRVCDHVGTVELHELRLHKEPRLTGTGAADDQHVFIPGRLGVFGAAVHRQPLRLGQDDVVPEVRVHIGLDVLRCSPAGGAVFRVFAELLGVLAPDIHNHPHDDRSGDTDEQVNRVEAGQR